ncbi:16S rRNA (uracil(1498)-N(3))-methyltransferase [Catenovulum sp. 2E275]|uniref:16S rRNA (uracil(1498)-N(3))-methyltransferase n=1 Tax=Catenovulum sp. 2E275 TaxID=2980497 RepID=UPI0021CF5381|nr:16S rRNA (uracil(1498)-N(3))-methyltransferase [Catenovulum sp. 2E275]MCU4676051.1 16S rRNA (uracil(1498)-N(3))-methyltransferase [Catenovulum sp. 2E275]
MRISRIYHPHDLTLNSETELSADASHHLGRVLRAQSGQSIILFNGDGFEYQAELTEVSKKRVCAYISDKVENISESSLKLHLGQVISRGDRMDFTIQKSVELGVTEITPLISERCGVKLNAERMSKKVEQWQKIAIAACEQSGRSFVPTINPVVDLSEWLAADFDGVRVNLHPYAKHGIAGLTLNNHQAQLLIGPEGGLSDEEISQAREFNFVDVLMGPRVLRTETAGLAAIALLQSYFGDLG